MEVAPRADPRNVILSDLHPRRAPRLKRCSRPGRAAICTLFVLACGAALAPASASAFEKAIWGNAYRGKTNEFKLYQSMGVKLYETDIDWSLVAPKKPKSLTTKNLTNPKNSAYHWPAYLAQEVALAKKYKLSVMIQVKGSPAWANGGHQDGTGVTGEEWAPSNAAQYADFVEAVAKKYPSVHLWMVWGEPDRGGDFMPWVTPQENYANPTPEQQAQAADQRYAEMLNDSSGVLKALSKQNLVIGGNTWTAGAISAQTWMADMKLPDGKRPRIDMWGHNPFGDSSPSFLSLSYLNQNGLDDGAVFYQDLPLLEQWTKQYFGHSLKLFLSEWNVETECDETFGYCGGRNNPAPPSETTAASWVKTALQESAKASWIYALGWINVYDSRPYCVRYGFDGCLQTERTTGTGLFYWHGKAKPDETSWKKYG